MDARFLSPEQIAGELGVSLRTVYRRIHEMRPIRVGSALRVARVDLENWIRRQREIAVRPSQDSAGEATGPRAPSDASEWPSIPVVRRRRKRPSTTP